MKLIVMSPLSNNNPFGHRAVSTVLAKSSCARLKTEATFPYNRPFTFLDESVLSSLAPPSSNAAILTISLLSRCEGGATIVRVGHSVAIESVQHGVQQGEGPGAAGAAEVVQVGSPHHHSAEAEIPQPLHLVGSAGPVSTVSRFSQRRQQVQSAPSAGQAI